ncbi:Hypothetical predicted protein [Paramuricea clavata]|uniref:Uncharacterized protein n=1 Tax=Paramuricea clavata TaxID=317549 RepID=A0A7D9J7H8_PARCT|nr:Hypothetical predicted protein [Paramuricea clavata]
MNSKIKSVYSKYGSLLQFFILSFSQSLRVTERKHHRLIACARRPTLLMSIEDNLQQYGDYITPYTFKHIQDQAEFSDKKDLDRNKKALKAAKALASVASEGGMKTFDEHMMQMKALLESWQTGKPFHMVSASQHSIPRNVSEKIDELFTENDKALTDKESKTTSTSGKAKVAPRKKQ